MLRDTLLCEGQHWQRIQIQSDNFITCCYTCLFWHVLYILMQRVFLLASRSLQGAVRRFHSRLYHLLQPTRNTWCWQSTFDDAAERRMQAKQKQRQQHREQQGELQDQQQDQNQSRNSSRIGRSARTISRQYSSSAFSIDEVSAATEAAIVIDPREGGK